MEGVPERKCRYCGDFFPPRQPGQKFCRDSHRRMHQQEKHAAGNAIVEKLVELTGRIEQLTDEVRELQQRLRE